MASVPRTPIPEHERSGETVGIQGFRLLFSVARCTRPVNGFQIETCPQFWNLDRRRPGLRKGDAVLIGLLRGSRCSTARCLVRRLPRHKLQLIEYASHDHAMWHLDSPAALRFAGEMQPLLNVRSVKFRFAACRA